MLDLGVFHSEDPYEECARAQVVGAAPRSSRKDRAAVRAEIEVLRRERLAYEQEGMETRQALARSEAHCRALEARVTVLETEVRRHEWQRQAAIGIFLFSNIMRNPDLGLEHTHDTLEDTGSSS
ncbi:hypothetical protein Tco_1320571 [Tanacetum coccineum]